MSRMETHLRNFAGELISDDFELNVRIMAGSSYTELLRLLKALFRYRVADTTIRKQFDKLAKHLDALNAKRGKYIHADWFLSDGEKPIARRQKFSRHPKEGLKVDVKDNELQLLRDLNHEIDIGVKRLIGIKTMSSKIFIEHRSKTAKRPYVAWDKNGFPIRDKTME